MGSPGWLRKKSLAKPFFLQSRLFGLLPSQRLQHLGLPYKALDPDGLGWGVSAHAKPQQSWGSLLPLGGRCDQKLGAGWGGMQRWQISLGVWSGL